jgi:hypothetical protein
MGLLDTEYGTVNAKKPRNSDRIQQGVPMNYRGLLEAAQNIPVAGDALSGGMAVYDAAKGDYGSAAMNAVGLLPFVPGVGGMIKGPMGRIAENGKDSNMLADMLERAGVKSGYGVSREGSAVSPSQYVTFRKPAKSGEDFTRQVRISNHADKYPELASGVRTSSDPTTEITFEQATNWLSKEGFPTSLSSRFKEIPSWEQAAAIDSAKRNSLQGKLDGLIGAWRNMPKATRGEMPTIADIEAGMTALTLMRRK